jgi:hypothetical protein
MRRTLIRIVAGLIYLVLLGIAYHLVRKIFAISSIFAAGDTGDSPSWDPSSRSHELLSSGNHD